MSWLAYLFPSVRDLEDNLKAATDEALLWQGRTFDHKAKITDIDNELAVTRKARDEQTRLLLEARVSYLKLEEKWLATLATLAELRDVSDRFKQMWEQSAERAKKAEREAAFYRCAWGNVRKAVDNAVADQGSGAAA